MQRYKLFIDESGKPHQKHPSPYFIQVGCLVEDQKQGELRVSLDYIRYKYWGRTNVVFHSEHIGKKAGDFEILRNEETRKEFEVDLFAFLRNAPFRLIARATDKSTTKTWEDEKVLLESTEGVFIDYLAFLYAKGNAMGRVVFEASNFEQDKYYLQAFDRLLYPSWEQKHPEFTSVRERLTSLTLATKLNQDTEVQIADLFGYAVTRKIKKDARDSYSKNLVKILEHKLIKTPPNTPKAKSAYYQHLRGFRLIQGGDSAAATKKR